MHLFLLFLFVGVSCFPNNSVKEILCSSCQADNKNLDVIYFPDQTESSVGGKETKNQSDILVHERHIVRMRGNCNPGERVDRAGRCRESYK
ncbi:hypothetical protein Zmor_010200 [Zophobas morio]|uniref:Uncharacterized protein n=2 Tax=Zophobas morio TaxID=2755281 RepID=A0AA38IMT8_9CUCU|nr:hypothetical protein Zmor_010200 [Zophobas morio]